jgi:hypothetical protein
MVIPYLFNYVIIQFNKSKIRSPNPKRYLAETLATFWFTVLLGVDRIEAIQFECRCRLLATQP